VTILIVLVAHAGPAMLAAVALLSQFERGPGVRFLLGASRIATATMMVCALGVGAYVAAFGAIAFEVIGVDPLALSIRLDALSAVMFGLVAFLGLVVVQFSRCYLEGDKCQGIFVGRLCLTLCAVAMLVLSGSLLQLVVAWVGTGMALHRLLLYYANRPRALAAARKKFICARFGDAFLALAAVLLYRAFGTGDITTLLTLAREMSEAGETPLAASLAALSIVLAATLKSAQFPFHGWLTEVMETPTPVSALLHAGIVNAGGFLVVRLSDVVVLSSGALLVLVVVGALTALVGTVVMLTQTNIKATLAWSTVGQMGFMLLQCGFGAFSAAALHIVAHSLYKAHAFLASGSVVESSRSRFGAPELTVPRPGNVFAGLLAAGSIFIAAGALLGASPSEKPALVALGAIIALGLAQLLARGISDQHSDYLAGRFLLVSAGLSVLYFGLQHSAAWILGDVVASPIPVSPALMAAMVVLFGIIALMQFYTSALAMRWPGLYVHVSNGFYVNSVFDRLLGILDARRAGKWQGGRN